jgi:hypothetical protein
VQNWALKYWLGMVRRDLIRDEEDKLKEQFYIINHPDTWRKVVLSQSDDIGPDGQPELPITDPRQLDHWFNSLAGERGMTGAQAEAMLSGGAPSHFLLGRADGAGRKV